MRPDPPPGLDPRAFRQCLGAFVTTVDADGTRHGLTASSFNSVSLTPPLVLWSLARRAASLPVFADGSHYAIHVLAASQKALAERFATHGVDRWAGVDYTLGISGAPLLEGCVATFECFNRSRHEEGDHVIFVGEVERCTSQAEPFGPNRSIVPSSPLCQSSRPIAKAGFTNRKL